MKIDNNADISAAFCCGSGSSSSLSTGNKLGSADISAAFCSGSASSSSMTTGNKPISMYDPNYDGPAIIKV